MDTFKKDIVIGLDSSTQSTKAIAWTREGENLAEGRADIPMQTPQAGYVEQSIHDCWSATVSALKQVTEQIDATRVAGVAISNQRETAVFIDDEGNETHPMIVWLDERAKSEIKLVVEGLEQDFIHHTTGKPVDLTPVLYRLHWLRRHQPQILQQTSKILDVHGYLTYRLTGKAVASWTSADPFGIYDLHQQCWSAAILDFLQLSPHKFGTLQKPGSLVGNVTQKTCQQTGLAEDTKVFAAGGDGHCAGLGANAITEGNIYLNLGTALITGAWAKEALMSPFWRTLNSPTGEGYFLEGVQRTGTFFVNWFFETFLSGHQQEAKIFQDLESGASQIPIGSQGLLVCPYLSGCMDPHWDSEARATFTGISPQHGLYHFYRAILEAQTLESVRCLQAMQKHQVQAKRLLAVGGGGNNHLWCQMFADATGLPLVKSKSLEASALGAGMTAALGAGWASSFQDISKMMSSEGETIPPNSHTKDQWETLLSKQGQVYLQNK